MNFGISVKGTLTVEFFVFDAVKGGTTVEQLIRRLCLM
jgi:hypothetical protein